MTEATGEPNIEEFDKEFVIEVSVKINIKSDTMPDELAQGIVNKIKTKVHCNRETMTLVGIRTDVYEVYIDEED